MNMLHTTARQEPYHSKALNDIRFADLAERYEIESLNALERLHAILQKAVLEVEALQWEVSVPVSMPGLSCDWKEVADHIRDMQPLLDDSGRAEVRDAAEWKAQAETSI